MKKRARLWPMMFCCASVIFLGWVVQGFLLSQAIPGAELASYDHRDGKVEAEQDIEHGVPKWKVCGLQHDFETKAKIVKEKLGVEIDWFAGCEITEAVEKYALRYNSTMRAHLVSKLGTSVVSGVLGEPPPEMKTRQ